MGSQTTTSVVTYAESNTDGYVLCFSQNLTTLVRQFSSGLTFPRGIFFRIFWTGTTATAGYIYYKINGTTKRIN